MLARWGPGDGSPAELEAFLRGQFLAGDRDRLAALALLDDAGGALGPEPR